MTQEKLPRRKALCLQPDTIYKYIVCKLYFQLHICSRYLYFLQLRIAYNVF